MSTEKYRVPKAPLKWLGGKRYDAKWIIDHMPPHLHYFELMTFFRVLQDEAPFKEFHRRVALQPMSFPGWKEAYECESNHPQT